MNQHHVLSFQGDKAECLAFIDWCEGLGFAVTDITVFVAHGENELLDFERLRRMARRLAPGAKMFIHVRFPTFEDWALARLKFGKR